MLASKAILHREKGGTIWEISFQFCTVRKVVRKKVVTG